MNMGIPSVDGRRLLNILWISYKRILWKTFSSNIPIFCVGYVPGPFNGAEVKPQSA